MIKCIVLTFIFCVCGLSAVGATVVFTRDGASTGYSLDGIDTNWTAVSAVEVPGLTINFATALAGHTLNANAGDFGVTSSLPGETNDRFDFGETVLMSFKKDVLITKIDFSDFDIGETFNFIIGSATNRIAYDDLSDKTSDYIEGLSWNVMADEIIRLEVAGSGDSLSMDSIDLSVVVPEPATISLFAIAGLSVMMLRRIHFGSD